MIKEEKINEVKKLIKRGRPAGEIREEMLQQGYSKEDIDKCFIVKKIDMRSWFLFFSFVFLLAGIWALNGSGGFILQGKAFKLFSLSATMFIGYFWKEQKKKNKQNA